MGADFMVYICENPSDYTEAMPFMEYRVENLSSEVLDDIASDLLWYDSEEISEEHKTKHNLKEEDLWKLDDLVNIKIRNMVKAKLKEAVGELFSDHYRRDVAAVHLHDRGYLMTGGMSWGDLPTEACDIINLIDHSGITEGMSNPDFDYKSFKA